MATAKGHLKKIQTESNNKCAETIQMWHFSNWFISVHFKVIELVVSE
jgi:hypothetical protein